MPGEQRTFQETTAASGGSFSGQYLWSNTANWTTGVVPTNGDSVVNPTVGYDDIAALTLGSLTQAGGGLTAVVGSSLDVGTVTGGGYLIADAYDAGAPVSVTIGTIDSSGGRYFAAGTGAVLVDQSTTDLGEDFEAYYGGRVEIAATPASTSTLDYTAAPGTFALEDPGATDAVAVDNLGAGDVLELPGTSVSSVSFGTSSLTVTTSAGSYAFTNVSYASGAAINSYVASYDASTGLEAVTFAVCFCKGTLIRTPSGEIPVEHLAIGDTVVTWRGDHRPIIWIGVGQVLSTRGRRTAATPVIVRKGALADNVPHADLRVTKGHSFFIDGALIPVEFLVNHRSILWDDRAQEVSVYHVELLSHDILIANSAPAESYRDDGNRWLFQNANNAWDKQPQAPCALVLTGGAFVDRVWRRLLNRSGPRPGQVLTDDADLHLLVDGRRLDHTRRDGSSYTFCLPAAAGRKVVHIVSRAAAPDELGLARDPRVLGIALRNMIVLADVRHRIVEAADDRLIEGFHGHEPELDIRWTNGDAALPAALFDGFDGRVDLMLQVGCTTRYIATAERVAIAA